MSRRNSSGTRGRGASLRLGLLGVAVAIGAAALAGASNAKAVEPCRVEFADIRLEPYTSGDRNLVRAHLSGDHNYSAATNTGGSRTTAFNIVENDGFLVLAVFSARWRDEVRAAESNGLALPRIPRGEFESLKRAIEMGIGYYERSRVVLAASDRENLPAILSSIDDKVRLQREILSYLNSAAGFRASDDTIAVPSLGWIIRQPTRFRFGVGRELASQYRDSAIGDALNMFCNPQAGSLVVGRLACPPPPFAQGRDDGACPEGLTFSPILFPPPQP